MRYLDNHSVRAEINEEMNCQGLDFADLAESARMTIEELTAVMDPAHDLTLDELGTILRALDCDIRFEVFPR